MQNTTRTSSLTNSQTRTPNGTSSTYRGKSKYSQKKRFQKNKFVAPKVKAGPVFEYACVCHGEVAKKPELVKVRPVPKSPEEIKGLGHWRCSVTGKSTTVSVRKPVKAGVVSSTFGVDGE